MKKRDLLKDRPTILSRMLELVLIPIFIAQTSSIYIFYKRYWEKLSKSNSILIIKEIDSINKYYNKNVDKMSKNELLNDLNNLSSLDIKFYNNKKIKREKIITKNIFYKKHFLPFPVQNMLDTASDYFKESISLTQDKDNKDFIFNIEKENGVLSFGINKKKIFISNIRLILFWNLFSFTFISIIVIIFIKNQIKSIVQLKNFINDFSYLEKDTIDFKPRGAKEIREIGLAFLNMIKKTKSFLNDRTIMLAQISHDLNTPITRMKLQTEFIDDKKIQTFFKKNLNEMEKLIDEYILFTKGEVITSVKKVDIKTFFNDLINEYLISGYDSIHINFNLKNNFFFIKEESLKRAINNIINNALKYRQKHIYISIETNTKNVYIKIEDDGISGIDKKIFNKKTKEPFIFGENSKKTSGNGLGLSIVQQVILAHRGKVDFKKSKSFGGLLVQITIPIGNKIQKE